MAPSKLFSRIGKIHLSFGAGGFLGIYQVGVAHCIIQNAPRLQACFGKVGGSSVGALVGAVFVTNPSKISASIPWAFNFSNSVRARRFGAFSLNYTLMDEVRLELDALLPENAHTIASGKLYVSVTDRLKRKNVIFNHFDNREHLIECLMCSCYVPFVSSPYKLSKNLKSFIDGAFTNSLPRFEDDTITVSCFSGPDASICPPKELSADFMREGPCKLNNFARKVLKKPCLSLGDQRIDFTKANMRRLRYTLVPPTIPVLKAYYQMGYLHALNYLKKEEVLSSDGKTETQN